MTFIFFFVHVLFSIFSVIMTILYICNKKKLLVKKNAILKCWEVNMV